jgi:acyl-CoA thioester hydrolase
MFASDTYFIVRYVETDQMGIVHHSNYPIWYEAGRTDFIRKAGLPYSEIEKKGIMLPLIELKCKFINVAKYEDEVRINTTLKEFTKTRIVFYYQVFVNNGEKPISIGETHHAWTNSHLRPVNLEKASPYIFNTLKTCLYNSDDL